MGHEQGLAAWRRVRWGLITAALLCAALGGAGLATAAATAPPHVGSPATATATAQTGNPYGVPLETAAPDGSIVLDGSKVRLTERNTHDALGISWAIINRRTAAVDTSGLWSIAESGFKAATEVAQNPKYRDGEYLMVVNWKGPLDEPHTRELFAGLYRAITGTDLPGDVLRTPKNYLRGTLMGVLGASPGGAFFDHRDQLTHPAEGDLHGYLRLNITTGLLDFVPKNYVPVDTVSSETATRLTIRVGDETYTADHPDEGAGFVLIRLDAKTLRRLGQFVYRTNSNGDVLVGPLHTLANDLQDAADEPDHPLVILQSWGKPKGSSADWDRAALAIEKMGGTRQLFDDLNQPYAGGPGSDPTNGRTGGYAFIGRTGTTAPRAEVSHPLDNLPARLSGLLMLSRTADYEPMLVGAPSASGAPPVNVQLVKIANEAPKPFPVLAPGEPSDQVQAAENFIGGPDVMNVCQAGVTCNIRQSYYLNYRAAWQTIALALQTASGKCQEPHQGFTPQVCEKVRSQVFTEVQAANRVRHYLGPEGLQQPFGAAGVAALANLGDISQQIQAAVKPPPGDKTTSNALQIVSYLFKIGNLGGGQVATISEGLSGVFALASYMSAPDNSPDLIGPKVAAAAGHLGVDLATRYQTAGDQLDQVGQIIVSDYGKLMAVASKVDSEWNLGSVGSAREALIRAAKQTIVETLVPLAYPVLYDLGRIGGLQARNWNCFYTVFTTNHKYLFKHEPEGGQVVERFPAHGQNQGDWIPVMAIGATHTVGRQEDAYIPAPPGDVMDPLFKPVAAGGVGMVKLEFFTPRLFRYFRDNPRFGDSRLAFPSPNAESPDCLGGFPDPPGDSG